MPQQRLTVPGGNEKGAPWTEASDQTLEYWGKRIGQGLATGNSRYPEQDRAQHDAIQAEIKRRQDGGKRHAPRQQSGGAARSNVAIVKPEEVEVLCGSWSQPDEAMAKLRQAQEKCHLITPQTSIGMLPPGCAIATSALWLDPDRDTFSPGTKERALTKHALDRISAMAGISWDPQQSRRLDDRRDPYYCHFRAVGYVRDFDSTPRCLPGQVEIDLREGSAQLKDYEGEKGLQVARKFILRLAESKSMNRAIRKLGIRSSYTREELAKPFVVARIMFTGKTDDPELKRLFAEKTFEAFHGAQRALFGEPAAEPALPVHSAPPVGASDDEGDDYEPPPELGTGDRVVDMPEHDGRQQGMAYEDERY